MKVAKVAFSNGHYLETCINGTDQEIKDYYLNNTFNLGTVDKDIMAHGVKVEVEEWDGK